MPTHVRAVGEQPIAERRADEAGAAGDQRLHDEHRPHALGQPARPAVAIERGVHRRAGGERRAVGGAHHLVAEFHPHRRQHLAGRAHLDLVVVFRRLAIRAAALRSPASRTPPFPCRGSSILTRAADRCGRLRTTRSSSRSRRRPSCRFRRSARAAATDGRRRAHRDAAALTAPSAAALSSRVARSGSGVLKIADAGDEDAGAGGDQAGDVVLIDAAVDLDRRAGCPPRPAARAPHGV